MAKGYRLNSTIGSKYQTDLDDAWVVKRSLNRAGLYAQPDYGMTPYPDDNLFDAIERYQRREGLQVDGVMKPDGETESRMQRLLLSIATFRCIICGAWHGSVFSPIICWQCWNKGYR